MFTGIIEEIGTLKKKIPLTGGCTLQAAANRVLEELAVEDSISINGVCLTVTRIEKDLFEVTAVQETINRTTTGSLKPGDPINLERALQFNSRLGGHLVQGHVDGIATVRSFNPKGTGKILELNLPDNLGKYIVTKGSIAVNGVSLTVAEQHHNNITISVIPFSIENTNLKYLKRGSHVNIEVDILGKYVERFLKGAGSIDKIDKSWLESLGY